MSLRERLADALDEVSVKDRQIEELRQQLAERDRLIADLQKQVSRFVGGPPKCSVRFLDKILDVLDSYRGFVEGRRLYEWSADQYRYEMISSFYQIEDLARQGIYDAHQVELDFTQILLETRRLGEPKGSVENFDEYWELPSPI